MNNIIDSIQLSGTVYTLSAQTGGGGVPESAFTAYTAATDERISQDEEVTAAALNELNEAISSGSVTVDMAFDSGSTNPVANSVITPAVTKHYEGQLPAEYTGGYSGGTYVGGFSAETYDDAASYVIRNTIYTTRMYKDGIRLKFIDSGNTETQVFACSASTYYNTVYNSPSSYANITIDTVGKNIEITPINNYRLSYVCFYGYYDNSLTTNITNKFSATSYQSFDKTAIQLIDDLSTQKQDKLPISAGTGPNSIIENNINNIASGQNSHAEGNYTTASGFSSHAEGSYTSALTDSSHAEGNRTSASGQSSHAEGYRTSAMTDYSHAEGYWTKTSGYSSHAEGEYTTANGSYSHTEGYQTITTNQSEHASGQYNVSNSASTEFGDSGNTLFSVGNGDWSVRHNAFEIRQNGDIYLSSGGTDIKLQDHLGGGGSVTVDTELDSGSTNPVQNKVIYNKIDEVEEVTAAALNVLNESLSGKQDTLIAGTNITISGNVISAEGGGKAVSGGTNISITTGETADTINCILPLTITGNDNSSLIRTNQGGTVSQKRSFAYGTNLTISPYDYSNSAAFGTDNSIGGQAAFVCGRHNTISNLGGFGFACGEYNTIGYYSTGGHIEGGYNNIDRQAKYAHSEGYYTRASKSYCHTEGLYTIANNQSEHASGQYNISSTASTSFGNSGNTLFSVGNGTSTSARHNAFEIRQNGDIYLTKDGQDVKLQDQLGGSSITIDTALDSGSTNPVENRVIYNKIDEVEQVTAAGLNALNDKITPTVELTQAEYDALTTKDPNTYYIITDAEAGDLTQYWTSAQTQSAINQATSGKTNQSDFTGHTANTNVHLTTTEKTNLDSLATNISAISGITASKKSNWDTAYSRSVDNAVSYIQNTSDYSSFINKIWAGTQSQYDQLAYKDNYTLYIIKDNN